MYFVDALLNQGGLALSGLTHGVVIRLFYAHPFTMIGTVNPNQPWAVSVWDLASGFVVPY
jgi:hypothetical protein